MPVLRPLLPSDLDRLLEVQREGAVAGLGHIFPQRDHPFPTDAIRARWEGELNDPSVDAFAIVLGSELAGFAATRANEFLHFGTAMHTWGTGRPGCGSSRITTARPASTPGAAGGPPTNAFGRPSRPIRSCAATNASCSSSRRRPGQPPVKDAGPSGEHPHDKG